ncbi:MAG TPA: hypothetical protein PLB81_09570 [Deltaproteobacteria bacterium]|nr:hypothetical protein [Deltaproteobacteria bacterium]
MCCEEKINKSEIAREVMRDIALDDGRMLAERQRAIDALTLFHAEALPMLEFIVRKADLDVLKERSRLYIQRIKSGAILSMSAV